MPARRMSPIDAVAFVDRDDVSRYNGIVVSPGTLFPVWSQP